MATTPETQLATMVANLAANTGRTIDEWAALVHASAVEKHGEMIAWLKREHGLTHGYANLIAHHARSGAAGSVASASGSGRTSSRMASAALAGDAAGGRGGDPIVAMLGGKEGLTPIVDAVMAVIRRLGDDVQESPKKGYLSVRRATQFATVHPSTKTRVDLGLKLKGVEPSGRLEAAGSWNAMVTHRVRLERMEEVDAEVARWITIAYEGAA